MELWTLWKWINIKSIKECMDIESGLMVWNTPRSAFFFVQNFALLQKKLGKKKFVTRFLAFFFFKFQKNLFWANVTSFLFMAIISSQTIKGFYFILASSRKRLPFIGKSLFTNDTIVENWKENIKQDMWFITDLNVNHALLNNNMHKRILRFSRPWCDTWW